MDGSDIVLCTLYQMFEKNALQVTTRMILMIQLNESPDARMVEELEVRNEMITQRQLMHDQVTE